MREVKNNLPKYWVVKLLKEEQKLFQKTVCPYLKEVYGELWQGSNINNYYGYDGNARYNGTGTWRILNSFKNNPTVLTLQEFIELSKPIKEPKNIYSVEEVKNNPKIIVYLDSEEEWNKLCEIVGKKVAYEYRGQYCYNVSENNYSSASTITSIEGYDEDSIIITLNQIKEVDMNNKKIIGYKLKPEFKNMRKAIEVITGFSNSDNDEEYFNRWLRTLSKPSGFLDRLSEAGVLDVWFEPIYKEEFKVGDIVVITKRHDGNSLIEGYLVKIVEIDNSKVPYKVEDYLDIYQGETSWCQDVRKATEEEIAVTMKQTNVKTFNCGDFVVIANKDRIIIKNKGSIPIDDFKQILIWYDNIVEEERITDYPIKFNLASIDIGYVKGIPIELIDKIRKHLDL